MNENYAPIILFVYNRPEHTRNTVEALLKNVVSRESELIIFSDGPQNKDVEESVCAVREYIRSISGFKQVNIYESEKNKGLANSVISGVTKVLDEYQRAIVVEDDIIVNENFLEYMNEALDRYQYDKQVYGVTAFFETWNESEKFEDAFFLSITSPWTWATWKDRWDKFDPAATGWEQLLSDKALRKKFDFNNTFNNSDILIAQMDGKLDSWWIRWYWTVFRDNGLYLTPRQALCTNKGFDGSGTHCSENGEWDLMHSNGCVDSFPSIVAENYEVTIKYQRYLRKRLLQRKIGRIGYYLKRPKEAWSKLKNRISKCMG